ncbi:MAG: hypothetical protein ABW148_11475 [Sedimenticola sp.]
MSEPLYDLFFSGEIMEDRDPNEVRSNIARIFKMDEEKLGHLFSGTPVKIKGEVDQDTAIKYRVAFRNVGALVDIRPCNSSVTTKSSTPAATEEVSLLPPRTGSLADFAVEKEPVVIPDITGINLAPAGSELDQTPSPATAEIDTSGLTLNPPNSGSLEDCHIEPKPTPIPDISELKLDDPDDA